MILKRMFTVFLVLLLVLPVMGEREAKASPIFSDVPANHSAYEEINYMKNAGFAGGYNEGGKLLFKPDHLTTRSQVTVMILNARNIQLDKPSKSRFTDIKAGTGLSHFAETAANRGLLVEKSTDGKFYPYLAVNLKEVSLLLSNSFGLNSNKYSTYPVPYEDIAKNDPYYKYISALYYSGILDDVKEIKPNKNVTRGEFSTYLARAANSKFRLELPIQGVTNPKVIGKVEVTHNNLHVRTSTNTSNSNNIIGKVNTGQKFDVYEDQSGWLKVNYNGTMAYISKQYTKYISEETTPTPEPTPEPTPPVETNANLIGRVTVNDLNVRSGPGASYPSVGILNTGDEVAVLNISSNNYWVKVKYGNTEGYTHKSYLKLLNKTSKAVKDRIIVIDPGHGGKDPGATSQSAVEKAIVLKVANIVKQKLQADGAKVVMTRTGDTYPTLQDRVSITKSNFGEVFVSIHVNAASSSSAKGTETYYNISSGDMYKEDIALATFINKQIVANAKMNDRGVREGDFHVIREMIIPSVLVELGFITNSEDRAKLVNDQYVQIFADSIYKGIVQYYSN